GGRRPRHGGWLRLTAPPDGGGRAPRVVNISSQAAHRFARRGWWQRCAPLPSRRMSFSNRRATPHRRGRVLTSALLCLALLTACSSDLLSADAGLADRLPPDYDELGVWSCHPDLDSSPCTREYEVTEVVEGGQTRTFSVGAATDPEVDCFYVHPTIGEDRGRNGDLSLDEGEDRIVWEQAALLRGSCRVFAPVFREATFRNGTPDGMTSDELDLAYGDVADAFRAYLDNWNEGRPFVVVGHSQGATLLLRLLAEVIEVDAGLRSSLVGAYLPGLGIAVDDSAVPVDVPTLPLCTELGQQHCLVAFSAYDAARPPGDDALFGRPWNTDGRAHV